MGIKKYTPYTPSRRNMTCSDFAEITCSEPEKSLCVSLKKNAGRNNQGKITVRHQGGGSRRKYRIIDFKRNKDNIPATVKSIEYDPNRTANIALICYADGEKRYILAPVGLTVGMTVMNGENAEPLFAYLAAEKPFEGFGKGLKNAALNTFTAMNNKQFGDKAYIKWNFTKFLINRQGEVVARFEPTTDMAEVRAAVAAELEK